MGEQLILENSISVSLILSGTPEMHCLPRDLPLYPRRFPPIPSSGDFPTSDTSSGGLFEDILATEFERNGKESTNGARMRMIGEKYSVCYQKLELFGTRPSIRESVFNLVAQQNRRNRSNVYRCLVAEALHDAGVDNRGL
jgi:hypothetical protein